MQIEKNVQPECSDKSELITARRAEGLSQTQVLSSGFALCRRDCICISLCGSGAESAHLQRCCLFSSRWRGWSGLKAAVCSDSSSSEVYRVNRNGDSTDPCGTPTSLTTTSDRSRLGWTNCGSSVVQSVTQKTVSGSVLIDCAISAGISGGSGRMSASPTPKQGWEANRRGSKTSLSRGVYRLKKHQVTDTATGSYGREAPKGWSAAFEPFAFLRCVKDCFPKQENRSQRGKIALTKTNHQMVLKTGPFTARLILQVRT